MEKLIATYIESKKFAWETTTTRSETARLNAHAKYISQGPEAHFLALKGIANPHTVKTIFKRISSFYQWQIEEGLVTENPYKAFMKKNALLFKGVYEKEKIEIGFQEAWARIEQIKDPDLKAKAIQLISTGMRWTESSTLDDLGMVTGKGRKRRRIFNSKSISYTSSYSTFLRKLYRATGLKPHSLRKLFATEMVNKGFTLPDLLKVMGWSSTTTAESYLQSRQEDELEIKLRKMVG